MLHAEECVPSVLALSRFGPAVGLTVVADVAVGGNEKPAGAGGWVLDDVVERWFHHCDHAIDEGPGGEVLAGAGLLLVGVLLQQTFVEIAKALLPSAVPVELVDLGHECGERSGFLDEGTSI